jgi:hypothetical protein
MPELPEVYDDEAGTFWVKAEGRSREEAIALAREAGEEGELEVKIVHGREYEHPERKVPWFSVTADGDAFWEVSGDV